MASHLPTPLPNPLVVSEGQSHAGVTTLSDIYEAHFDFVWRNLRRMGVPDAAAEDAAQDVFLVAHRRLSDFQHRSSVTTWLFGILLRVASDYRRTNSRHNARLASVRIDSSAAIQQETTPHDLLSRSRAVRLLQTLLDTLEDDKRAIFVMVELEEISVSEAAKTMSLNNNTAHARLRAARSQFQEALAAHRSRDVEMQAKAPVAGGLVPTRRDVP
ncbi:MAG: RNA polymerase sigma factor [Deltaproteobacteria bacterium]|nr:RNA polymerase sigma factor [Deltaproteobacteria bacterium]